MRELRRHLDAAVAEGRDGPLPLQRLRPLPQDERHEQTAGKAVAEISKWIERDGLLLIDTGNGDLFTASEVIFDLTIIFVMVNLSSMQSYRSFGDVRNSSTFNILIQLDGA